MLTTIQRCLRDERLWRSWYLLFSHWVQLPVKTFQKKITNSLRLILFCVKSWRNCVGTLQKVSNVVKKLIQRAVNA